MYGKEKWLGKITPCREEHMVDVVIPETTYNTLPFKMEAESQLHCAIPCRDWIMVSATDWRTLHNMNRSSCICTVCFMIWLRTVFGQAKTKLNTVLYPGVHSFDAGHDYGQKDGCGCTTGSHCASQCSTMAWRNIRLHCHVQYGDDLIHWSGHTESKNHVWLNFVYSTIFISFVVL